MRRSLEDGPLPTVTLGAGALQGRRPSDQAGFALVLTLVVIAALALVTAMMSAWLTTALEEAIANQHEAEARQQMADAKAVALYLLAACPVSFRGLEIDGWPTALDWPGPDPGTAQRQKFRRPR